MPCAFLSHDGPATSVNPWLVDSRHVNIVTVYVNITAISNHGLPVPVRERAATSKSFVWLGGIRAKEPFGTVTSAGFGNTAAAPPVRPGCTS